MKKIINVIVISFFIVFSINNIYGICLALPILLILSLHNNRNIIISIPLSILSTIVFNKEYLFITLILYIYIILFLLILKKKEKVIIELILTFIFMITILLIINNEIDIYKIVWFVFISFIAVIIFYLLKNLVINNFGNYYLFEMVCFLVVILSTTFITTIYNFPIYLSIFYIMYFSTNTNKIFSYLFSFVLTVYLYYIYRNNFIFILPVVNSIYIIGNILSSFTLVILLFIISIFLPQYFEYSLVVSVLCIIFEVLRKKYYKENYNKGKTIEEIKKSANDNLNQNILAFSSFLDGCVNDIEQFNNEEFKIVEGIENIKKNYCGRCYLKEKCKKDFYNQDSDFRNLIINCNRKNYQVSNNPLLSICPYNVEIRKSALIINGGIDFNNIDNKNGILKKTFTNISNILRQYVIDNNIKEEIDYKKIAKIKEFIISSGYDLCYFNVKDFYKENFMLEIGIRGVEYDEVINKLEMIFKKAFNNPFSFEYSTSDRDKVYIKIFNRKNIRLEVSSSNIANGSVSGDNIYIKENGNKFIAAICDGMGKGNNASLQSSKILSLFNRLNDSGISTYTSLQILNSYYQIKEEYDTYSTLDFLEIYMKDKKGVFYKMSAASSYIFKNNKSIQKIDNKLLPLGNEDRIEGKEIELNVDDVIVMCSDGVFESLVEENELNQYILNILHLPVEKIVLQIINYIKKNNRITEDDFSLIVIKILDN